MTIPEVEGCCHHWQPFYDAPELNGCVHCGAEQSVGIVRPGDHARVVA